jgi:peptide-methionine (R)-S-oxide reductase
MSTRNDEIESWNVNEKRKGTFIFAPCLFPMFDSETRYDSGTGVGRASTTAGHLGTQRDMKLILPRTEHHRARCGGHQGRSSTRAKAHGQAALQFVPAGEALPELRS